MNDPRLPQVYGLAMQGNGNNALLYADMVTQAIQRQINNPTDAVKHPKKYDLHNVYDQFLKTAKPDYPDDQQQDGEDVPHHHEENTHHKQKEEEQPKGFSAYSFGTLMRNIAIGGLWDNTVGAVWNTIADIPAHPLQSAFKIGSFGVLAGLIALTGGPTGIVALSLAAKLAITGGIGSVISFINIIRNYSTGNAKAAEESGRDFGSHLFNTCFSFLPFKMFASGTEAEEAFKFANVINPLKWPELVRSAEKILTGKVEMADGRTVFQQGGFRNVLRPVAARRLQPYFEGDLSQLKNQYASSFGHSPGYGRFDVFNATGNKNALREMNQLIGEAKRNRQSNLQGLLEHRDEIARIGNALRWRENADQAVSAYNHNKAITDNPHYSSVHDLADVRSGIHDLKQRLDYETDRETIRHINALLRHLGHLEKRIDPAGVYAHEAAAIFRKGLFSRDKGNYIEWENRRSFQETADRASSDFNPFISVPLVIGAVNESSHIFRGLTSFIFGHTGAHESASEGKSSQDNQAGENQNE